MLGGAPRTDSLDARRTQLRVLVASSIVPAFSTRQCDGAALDGILAGCIPHGYHGIFATKLLGWHTICLKAVNYILKVGFDRRDDHESRKEATNSIGIVRAALCDSISLGHKQQRLPSRHSRLRNRFLFFLKIKENPTAQPEPRWDQLDYALPLGNHMAFRTVNPCPV